MNKCICILNETFLKVVNSIIDFSLSCIYLINIVVSTTSVMPFHMKKAS